MLMANQIRPRYESEALLAVIVDVQERLVRHMNGAPQLCTNIRTVVEGLTILGVNVLSTEQYPKGLGHTVSMVSEVLPDEQSIEKMEFSCYENSSFRTALEATGKRRIIIAGIEAHVCVQQTTLDLLRADYEVTILGDCVSSRRERDRKLAIEHMRDQGAHITTLEALLFELCTISGSPQFKKISRLVK